MYTCTQSDTSVLCYYKDSWELPLVPCLSKLVKKKGDFLSSDPKKDEVPTHLPFLPLVPKA